MLLQDAIEERIIERAMQKLKLDQMVIQAGRSQPAAKGQSIFSYTVGTSRTYDTVWQPLKTRRIFLI
jgi:hypothetical protein